MKTVVGTNVCIGLLRVSDGSVGKSLLSSLRNMRYRNVTITKRLQTKSITAVCKSQLRIPCSANDIVPSYLYVDNKPNQIVVEAACRS